MIGYLSGFKPFVELFGGLAYQFKLFAMSVKQFGVIKTLGATIASLVNPIGLVVTALAAFAAGFAYLMATSEEFRNNMLAYVDEIWNGFVKLGDTIYKSFIEPVMNAFASFGQAIWDNGLSQFIEQVSYFISELMIMITAMLDWLSATILPVVTAVIEGILAYLRPAISFIIDIINAIMPVLTSVVQFITDVFKGDWESVWKDIGNIFISIWNGIVGAVESVINWIIDSLNALIGKFMWMNDILDFFGGPQITGQTFERVTLERYPLLASGGIAYGETAAIVGEYANARSNPEVIAPLDKLETIIGGSTTTTQEELLREQNDLLRAILDKDTDVKLDGRSIARAMTKNQAKLGYAIMG